MTARDQREVWRILGNIESNNDESCVAIFNGFLLIALTTIRFICEILRENFTIHTLSLRRCGLAGEDVNQIAVALKNHGKIESLDFSFNRVDHSSIQGLSENLHHVPNLLRLSLESIDLGDSGANLVAQHLLNHPRLDALNLARNSIRDDGAFSLARALIRSTLGWLDLSHNEISANGAQHLVHTLRQRQQHMHLDLAGNDVPEQFLNGGISNHTRWEEAQRLDLENGIYEPRHAQPGQEIPPPPLSTLVHLDTLGARLFDSCSNGQHAQPLVLSVHEGEIRPQVTPEESQHDIHTVTDLVPNHGTGHRDVAAWEDYTRFLTSNFDERRLIEQTIAFRVYACQRQDMAATLFEPQWLLRMIDPNAPQGSVDRDEEISNFEQRNLFIRFQEKTYCPMLCVVLPQNGNIFQFFCVSSARQLENCTKVGK